MNLRNYAVQSYYDYATETFYCALLYVRTTNDNIQTAVDIIKCGARSGSPQLLSMTHVCVFEPWIIESVPRVATQK